MNEIKLQREAGGVAGRQFGVSDQSRKMHGQDGENTQCSESHGVCRLLWSRLCQQKSLTSVQCKIAESFGEAHETVEQADGVGASDLYGQVQMRSLMI